MEGPTPAPSRKREGNERSPFFPPPACGRGRGWALSLLFLLTACQPWSPPPVADTARPRIVSLNPCTDAILAQVSAPGQLLAISHYSHDPSATSMDLAEAARFPETSDAVEDIAAFAPDLVVASAFLPPATVQALRDMGMRVVLEPSPTDVPGALEQVRRLAKLAGNRSEGEALAGRIDAALAKAAPPPGARRIPALLWESGGIVAGEGTLIADLIRRTGFTNAAAARGLGQADYLPLERVLADPPQVILTAGGPASEEDRMLRHPALAHVPGMARAPLDRSLIWCGGPTIPRAVERLAVVRRSFDKLRPFDKLRVIGGGGYAPKPAHNPNPAPNPAHAELVEAPRTKAPTS